MNKHIELSAKIRTSHIDVTPAQQELQLAKAQVPLIL
jgi:hypothetical protein